MRTSGAREVAESKRPSTGDGISFKQGRVEFYFSNLFFRVRPRLMCLPESFIFQSFFPVEIAFGFLCFLRLSLSRIDREESRMNGLPWRSRDFLSYYLVLRSVLDMSQEQAILFPFRKR